MFSIHFVADDNTRIYSCVTDKEYPARIAFAMLEEMQTKFLTKVSILNRQPCMPETREIEGGGAGINGRIGWVGDQGSHHRECPPPLSLLCLSLVALERSPKRALVCSFTLSHDAEAQGSCLVHHRLCTISQIWYKSHTSKVGVSRCRPRLRLKTPGYNPYVWPANRCSTHPPTRVRRTMPPLAHPPTLATPPDE